jgi:hypothetical protein
MNEVRTPGTAFASTAQLGVSNPQEPYQGRTEVSRLPIRTVLELSTGHIPKHTADALGHGRSAVEAAELWNLLPYEPWADYGWIVCVTGDVPEEVKERHPELGTLLAFCCNNNIRYLQLDSDGYEMDDFPTFDW